jgi:PIN domain nuclease of toxin-antitoxin system
LNLLLDTHIWLWGQIEPQKLGRRVQHELHASGNERWLSPISVWEAEVLHRKRRLVISGNISDWFEQALKVCVKRP